MLIWDDLTNGRTPRWLDSGIEGAASIDAMLADALTGGV